ncbi:anti-sigma-D factor RsdA [Micromonospora sp. SL1-18]|uniref:anti-sigma-D factor RsdA n=1 Tax=Micromonospora sp. SL1-18 TaxID=3399128 RepID=UPI003A4D5BBE
MSKRQRTNHQHSADEPQGGGISERTPGAGEKALDLDVLTRDDMLLDALGKGEATPADDELAALLAAWHADLTHGAPEPAHLRPPVADADAPASAATVPLRPDAPSRRPRPWTLRLAAAAAAFLALVSGLGIGSRSAEPGSPLWSLAKLLYPQQAEVRVVERTIAEARAALAAGRPDQARQLVDQAREELTVVTDPSAVDRLRGELDALSAQLRATPSTVAPTAGSPSPSRTPSGRPTSSTPRPGNTATSAPAPMPSQPGTSGAEPSEARSPLLPLPQLPLPLPSSPLPGLPLPTGDLLESTTRP